MNAYREAPERPREPTPEEEWKRLNQNALRASRPRRVARVAYFMAAPTILVIGAMAAAGCADITTVACVMTLGVAVVCIGEAMSRQGSQW